MAPAAGAATAAATSGAHPLPRPQSPSRLRSSLAAAGVRALDVLTAVAATEQEQQAEKVASAARSIVGNGTLANGGGNKQQQQQQLPHPLTRASSILEDLLTSGAMPLPRLPVSAVPAALRVLARGDAAAAAAAAVSAPFSAAAAALSSFSSTSTAAGSPSSYSSSCPSLASAAHLWALAAGCPSPLALDPPFAAAPDWVPRRLRRAVERAVLEEPRHLGS